MLKEDAGYNQLIKEKIKLLPLSPGIYIFKDKAHNIIYVGSSAALNKRVASYFQKNKDFKTEKLSKDIYDFDYIATNSLKEALILENNLIKKHKPKYNIKLKDDKKYPFIEIAAGVKYPYIKITRNIFNPKSFYSGPYTNVKSLRRMLYIIRKIFKVRTCRHNLDLKKIKGCIYNNIKLCSAPCLNHITESSYNYNVSRVTDFLSGKISFVIKNLQNKIKTETNLLNFETCAYFQKILNEIKSFSEKQKVFFRKNINADYIGICGDAFLRIPQIYSLSLLQIREGKLIEEKNFIFKNPANIDIAGIIIYFIKKTYPDLNFAPLKFYISLKIKNKDCFKEELGENIKIHYAYKGINKDILELADKNAELKFTHQTVGAYHPSTSSGQVGMPLREILQKFKTVLKLKKLPILIKAVDISNISGSFPTGSVVCFKNAVPDKKNYRHYIIKSLESRVESRESNDVGARCPRPPVINDYAMIEEVVRRSMRVKKDRPDLLIIDGGKGHLNTALKVLREMNISDVELLSIAKKEELLFRPDTKYPVNIHAHSEILNLIRYIRDEAHRFAIRLHKKRRGLASL